MRLSLFTNRDSLQKHVQIYSSLQRTVIHLLLRCILLENKLHVKSFFIIYSVIVSLGLTRYCSKTSLDISFPYPQIGHSK